MKLIKNDPAAPRSALPDDPWIGRTVLDDYAVEKKIGQGGMGAVYRLRHRKLPKTFLALKILKAPPDLKARRILAKRFEQEAIAAAAVGSHRVCKPITVGTFDDGTEYIVMEYVEGRSLSDELYARGALPVAEALKIAFRIADTMVIAHENGIVHRDLKPGNVMLVREGQRESAVKLLDFGIASAEGALKVAFTAPQTILGTVGYMSPEASVGEGTDGRTDVFSLGVILFKMLAGEVPFRASNPEAVAKLVLGQDAPAVSSRRPPGLDPVPGALEIIVARALAKRPADRFTMAELQQALHRALEAAGDPHTNLSAIAPASVTASIIDVPTTEPGSTPSDTPLARPRLAEQTAKSGTPTPAERPQSIEPTRDSGTPTPLEIPLHGEAAAPSETGRWWLPWVAIAAVSIGAGVVAWRVVASISRRPAVTVLPSPPTVLRRAAPPEPMKPPAVGAVIGKPAPPVAPSRRSVSAPVPSRAKELPKRPAKPALQGAPAAPPAEEARGMKDVD